LMMLMMLMMLMIKGTCVNVGCIPKKMFHAASLYGESHKEMDSFGWVVDANQRIQWFVNRINRFG